MSRDTHLIYRRSRFHDEWKQQHGKPSDRFYAVYDRATDAKLGHVKKYDGLAPWIAEESFTFPGVPNLRAGASRREAASRLWPR